MSKTKELRRIAEWAAELKISRKAIQRAIGWGHLRATRLGIGDTSPYYIDRADIDAWLDSRVVGKRAW